MARIARELRLRALERPSHLPSSPETRTISSTASASITLPLFPVRPFSKLPPGRLAILRVPCFQAPTVTHKPREQRQIINQVPLPLKSPVPLKNPKSETQIRLEPPSFPNRSTLPTPPAPTSVRPALHSLPTCTRSTHPMFPPLSFESERAKVKISAPPLIEPFATIRKRVGPVQISVSVPLLDLDSSPKKRSNGESVYAVTAHKSAQRTTGGTDGDAEHQSSSRASVVEESLVQRRPLRKRVRPAKLRDCESNSSALETSDEECETGAADWPPDEADSSDRELSLTSAGSESSFSEELSDMEPSEDMDQTEFPTGHSEMGISNSSSTPLQEELTLNNETNKFLGILMRIRKELVEYTTQQPAKSLLPRKRLMRVVGKFRIRTGYGIRGKPKQLIHRVLQMERRPDVENACLRASKQVEMDDSQKAAMDALALVCIAMSARVPLDFRAFGPLMRELWLSEGAAPIKGHRPVFTNVEAYRLLRLYLLLGAYKIPGPLSLPPRNVFICASMRNKNCLPLKWLSGQLNRDLIKRKDPFVAFTNALEYVNKKWVHNRIRWQNTHRVIPDHQPILVAETPNLVGQSQLLPPTALTPTCCNFESLSSVTVKIEPSPQVTIAPTSTASSIVSPDDTKLDLT